MTEPGRLLGVDYGTVRVGLSVSDPDRKIAFPLTTYNRRGHWRRRCGCGGAGGQSGREDQDERSGKAAGP